MTKRSVNNLFTTIIIKREPDFTADGVKLPKSHKSSKRTTSYHAVTFRNVLSILLLGLAAFGCSPEKRKLTIATAANMQYAMEALKEAYEEKSGRDIQVIIGSSGKLTAQIQQGAPFDIFLSADSRYPELLYEKKLTEGRPQLYAQGQLVLWTLNENFLLSIDQLQNKSVSHIAMANPKTAPYGRAADEALDRLGITAEIQGKLVYGESIAQVNQFITTKAADLGFTSKSSVIANPKGNWITIPDSLFSPIDQSLVMLKNERGFANDARSFVEFLNSQKGREILNKFGYRSKSD